MKRLNRIFRIVCITALLFSVMPAVHAQTAPTLYFTNSTLTVGSSSVYCYLKMDHAENIAAMDYRILYDAAHIEFDRILTAGFTAQSDVTISVNTDTPGIIHVTLVSKNGLSGNHYLNRMYFRAKETAVPGEYPITVLVTDIYNASLETVVAEAREGTITVKESTPTVQSVNFSNAVSSSSVRVGDSVDYKLSASRLNALSAGMFDFTYDAAKLQFDRATTSSAMQKTVYDINSSMEGLVKLSFASESAITSGSNLVTLHFIAIAPGTADIACKPFDLYDSVFEGMTGNEVTKTVTIEAPVIKEDYPDFWIDVPETVPSDKEFTVKAVLEGESLVRAGDFVVNYDGNALECLGVTSETVNNAWVVTDEFYDGGKISFSFLSNVDIAEDTALVSIRFKSKNNLSAVSTVTAMGTDVYNAAFEVVTLDYINCEIKVVRPEYTVNFYDADGQTLLSTQKILSGNSAIPPKVTKIRKYDVINHLTFSDWNKEYSVITDHTHIVAVYVQEAHTVAISPEGDGATHCSICEEVLTYPGSVQPPGVHIKALLDAAGTLTVSGILSVEPATEGKTFLAVYDREKYILCLQDVTTLNKSDFSFSAENMGNAHTVKIFTWHMTGIKPLHDSTKALVIAES